MSLCSASLTFIIVVLFLLVCEIHITCILVNGFKLFLLKVGQKLPLSSGSWASPGGSDGKESTCNAGDPGSIPGLGRSPGEGNGNPLQCSCLKNPMDQGAWWATVLGIEKSRTRLSDQHTQWILSPLSEPTVSLSRFLMPPFCRFVLQTPSPSLAGS